jgi:predicted aminopeptidase
MKLTAFFAKKTTSVLFAVIVISGLLTVSACQSTQFLWQAARGQWQIIAERRPLQELIRHPGTPAKTAARLRYVESIRRYAAQQLHLPVEDAYADYVDLQRPYAVWNLFVTPELELTNQTWCFPIAGCVAYQGYFSEEAAKTAAQNWQQQGFDTYIGGVTAYSTLGWFDDPVLNTFLFYDPINLAALLFHELAHRQLYIPGDTAFNESWATAVEQVAVEQFLQEIKDFEPTVKVVDKLQIDSYRTRYKEHRLFVGLIQETVNKLREVYASDRNVDQKRKTKTKLMDQLRWQYQQAVAQRKISERYQNWFAYPLNNAKLSTVVNYHQWVPGLRFKIISLASDWPAFYRWSAKLAELDNTERTAQLEKLNRQALLALSPEFVNNN